MQIKRYSAYFTKSNIPRKQSGWLRAIPRDNIPNEPNTFVCEDHWAKGYESIIRYGEIRPKNPPCLFTQCVAQSQVKSRLRHLHQDKQPKIMLLPVMLYLMSSLHFYRKIGYYRMKILVRRLCHGGKSRYFRSCDLFLHWRKRTFRLFKVRISLANLVFQDF